MQLCNLMVHRLNHETASSLSNSTSRLLYNLCNWSILCCVPDLYIQQSQAVPKVCAGTRN